MVHSAEVVTTQRRQVLMPFSSRLEANSTTHSTLKCSYQVPSEMAKTVTEVQNYYLLPYTTTGEKFKEEFEGR